jgi:HD-GYP domain-containing protein (c-di-GMP phosphodiesterase class II)
LLLARVIAVAEGFDAMTCERPYRPALTQSEAIDALRRGRGLQWDPTIVDALIRVIERG